MAQDSVMMYIEDDIEKIQLKTNLYIKAYGFEGAFHLVKEIVQNSIDELKNPKSLGTYISVIIDRLEDSITVEDDGRGISETEYPLDICCTKIQAGSKFMRDDGELSAGEFGLGLTACNALADEFEMTSYREREKTAHRIAFKNGKKVSDTTTPIGKKDKRHGMITKMIPSKKYLGPTTHLPVDMIEDWLGKISYFFTSTMLLEFFVKDGMKTVKKVKFEKRDPVGLLNDICTDNVIFKPIVMDRYEEFDEEVINTNPKIKSDTVTKHRIANYSLMIAYDDSIDPMYDSYCNFTNTVSGGVHLDAAENAYCNFIQKAVKDSMTEAEKSKYDILWNDIRTGLKMVVNLTTNANVQFEGNVKEKIKAEILKPILTAGFKEEIKKFFDENPEKLKAVVKIVKTNAKARVEATKARAATVKDVMTPLKEQQIPNYDRCLNTGKNDYREIFIAEGDSAKGAGTKFRNPWFQAFFAVRGMTASPYKKTITQLMDPNSGNKEWRTFVHILRCGIGRSFDINKLYFDKIIILTDADVDGHGISGSIAAFFINALPEVVLAGRLYKALPPLYKVVDGKNEDFVHNKEEFVDMYRNKVIKNYSVKLAGNKEKASKDEFRNYLVDTVDYLATLTSVAEHFKSNVYLVELVAAFFAIEYAHFGKDFDIAEVLKNQKVLTKFMSIIQKRFPEVVYKEATNELYGIVDGHCRRLALNQRFINKVLDLIDIFRKYGYIILVNEKDDFKPLTLSEFAMKYQKYIPSADKMKRFKGLGEMKPEDLNATTLDPFNGRVLIQLTIDDLKKELKVFDKLYGTTKKDKLARKKMMNEFRIKAEDLDN